MIGIWEANFIKLTTTTEVPLREKLTMKKQYALGLSGAGGRDVTSINKMALYGRKIGKYLFLKYVIGKSYVCHSVHLLQSTNKVE